MGWWKDFANSLVETTAAGLTSSLATGVSGEKSGLGSMLSEGTQSDFDKYVSARQAAVKGEYDKYTQKFDAFEEQAKQFAGLVGSPSSQNLGTELDGMEVAARYMQGKSQSQINDTIAQLKKLKAEGKNIREARPDLFKRGADQEIRNYTAQDIARMQLGGAFSYTPKPYDLSKRRTGLARFLRDDLGLYGETFAKEREAVAERQARDITAALPGYDKYAGTGGARYTQTQAAFDFGAGDLRTAAELRAERRDIAQTDKAEFDLTEAKVAAKERKELFEINKSNAWLQNQINKGTISDQEVERRRKKALAVISGDAQMEAVAKAQEAYNKNPSPETARELRFARSDYSSQQTAANFYKNVNAEVSRLKALDPKFTSKKREGIVKGASTDVTGYTGEQAAAAEEKLWKQASVRMYMSMKSSYADTVDVSPFYLHMKPEDVENMVTFADTVRRGFDKLGVEKTKGQITLDVIKAGVSTPEEANKLIRFASETNVPIRNKKGDNIASRTVEGKDLPPIDPRIDVAAEPEPVRKIEDEDKTDVISLGKEGLRLRSARERAVKQIQDRVGNNNYLLQQINKLRKGAGRGMGMSDKAVANKISQYNAQIQANEKAINEIRRAAGIK